MLVMQTNKLSIFKPRIFKKNEIECFGANSINTCHIKKLDVKLGLGTGPVKLELKIISIWNVVKTKTYNSAFKFLPSL